MGGGEGRIPEFGRGERTGAGWERLVTGLPTWPCKHLTELLLALPSP